MPQALPVFKYGLTIRYPEGHALAGQAYSGCSNVQLRKGELVVALSEVGVSGFYVAEAVPAGRYELYVSNVASGQSFAVGEGELAGLGYDAGKGLQSTASGLLWATAPSAAWASITGKPSEFPPTQHPHNIAEVSGLETRLHALEIAESGTVPTPLVLTTDGVGTDNALTIGTATGIAAGKSLAVDVATDTPFMRVSGNGSANTIEAVLSKILDNTGWASMSVAGITVQQTAGPHTAQLTATDLTFDGVSIAGNLALKADLVAGKVPASQLPAALALGTTSSTAYRGDYGNTAYTHSQTTGNPHGTTIAGISGLQGALDAKATDTNVVHKTGDENIDGRKVFSYPVIKAPAGSLGVLGIVPPTDTAGNDLKGGMQWLNAAENTRKAWVGYRSGIVGEDLRVTSMSTAENLAAPKVRIGTQLDSSGNSYNSQLVIGSRDGTYCSVWAGGVAPTTDNYTLLAGQDATLINAPKTADTVHIRNGNTKCVSFSADPTAYGTLSDVGAAHVGGYSTSGWALWPGNVTASSQNYSLYTNGGGSSTIINGSTESVLRVGNSDKVKAQAAVVTIMPTTVESEGLDFQKYTGSSSAAIYNRAVTPSNTNYAFVCNTTGAWINGTANAGLCVNNASIVTATSTGANVAGSLTSTGAVYCNGFRSTLGATIDAGGYTQLLINPAATNVYNKLNCLDAGTNAYFAGGLVSADNIQGYTQINVQNASDTGATVSLRSSAIHFGGAATGLDCRIERTGTSAMRVQGHFRYDAQTVSTTGTTNLGATISMVRFATVSASGAALNLGTAASNAGRVLHISFMGSGAGNRNLTSPSADIVWKGGGAVSTMTMGTGDTTLRHSYTVFSDGIAWNVHGE